jgi:hypothetical protein
MHREARELFCIFIASTKGELPAGDHGIARHDRDGRDPSR